MAIFETIALGQLVLYPFSFYTVGSLAWYQAQAFRWLGLASPLLLVVLLYSWVAILALSAFRRHSVRTNSFVRAFSQAVKRLDTQGSSAEKFVVLQHPRLLLII